MASKNLLSNPSLVESPFIIVKIGNKTFGQYTRTDKTNMFGSTISVDYPNYMKKIQIEKINGEIGKYIIGMEYQISAGDDPNMLEKVFSSVGYGEIEISYGDWSTPNYIFKNEKALITKVTSNVDFGQSRINYTIEAVGTALSIMGSRYDFPKRKAKPSNIIKSLVKNSTFGLSTVFKAMASFQNVINNNWIASDDKVVEIQAKSQTDVISYINYLCSCMVSVSNTALNVIKDSNYYMSIHDNLAEGFQGAYFTIQKVLTNAANVDSYDTFEVNLGYPTTNYVTNFALSDNNTYSLLYKYSGEIGTSNYVYRIDNNGNTEQIYSPSATRSKELMKTTPTDETWWTQITSYPISATLTIKGLTRPSMLMSYVRIKSYFFGQLHISSGLYIITKQVDTIDQTGFKTTLSLTRIKGDVS